MTISIHATVTRRHPEAHPDAERHWVAVAWVRGFGLPRHARRQFAPTWHDAMAAAQELRGELERLLMDEVHESRASRRPPYPALTRCGGCRDLGPHTRTPDCDYYVPEAP